MVDMLLRIDLNLFCILILAFVFVSGYTRLGWQSLRYRLFMVIVAFTAANLALESVTWALDGVGGTVTHAANTVLNAGLLLCAPLPGLIWVLYLHALATRGNSIPRGLLLWLFLPYATDCAAIVSSPLTHVVFLITSANTYARGPFYMLHATLCLLYLAYGAAFVLARRKEVEASSFTTLLLFPLAPMVGAVIQVSFLGLTTVWSLLTFSLLLTYVNIQDRRLSTDYLTGTYNRRHLDRYVNDRIGAALANPRKPGFAVAFADLDHFKQINDVYGHVEGDSALIAAGSLLKGCLRSGDLVARYAGDEFVLVLELDSDAAAFAVLDRIEFAFASHTRVSKKPYPLSVSIGYCIFDRDPGTTAETMVRRADRSMLEHKHKARAQMADGDATEAEQGQPLSAS